MLDSFSYAGIKSTSGNYLSITSSLCHYMALPRSMESGGYNDYLLFNECLSSPYYNGSRYAEELMAEDEECFRGRSLFIFDSYFIGNKLHFMMVHKSPYRTEQGIEGVIFHDVMLPKINQSGIQLYLSNPDIIISGHTKNHIDIQSSAPARTYGLSKREKDCLYYLVKGHTALEIAGILKLSRRTIESYLSHAKDKLGVRKVSELVAFILVNDVLPGLEPKDVNKLL